MIVNEKRSVDTEHPWLGLESFTEGTKQFFFGRDAEIRDIFLRVREHQLTILYGQSGLGKSSLLGAGLIPKLKIERFRPYLIRLAFEPHHPSLVQQTVEAFEAALSGAGERTGSISTHEMDPGVTLWEGFHRDPCPIKDLHESPPVLIFDQFEETFTLARQSGRQDEAEELLRQLADLVENRPPFELQARFRADPGLKRGFDGNASPVRIVIALRDDFLSHLQGWKNIMPSVTRNQMPLHLLDGTQALQAIVRPGRLGGGELVSEAVGAQIVRFVTKQPPDAPLEQIEAVPPLVSLMCDELNGARLVDGAEQITSRQVEEQSADILQSFYDRSFDGLHASVREFVEDRMITVGGHRIPVAREDAEAEMVAAGVPEPAAAIARLVQRRLLVPDERGGVQQLWITHDVLAPLVIRSRDDRRERQRADQAELQAQEIRRDRRRALALAVAFAILLLISVLASVFGWSQARVARARAEAASKAEKIAESERDTANKSAEKLEATLARSNYFLAVARWKEGRVSDAQNLLWRVPPKHRNIEWRHDNRIFQGGYMTLYGGGGAVAFSPDGTRIAAGSRDGTIKLWDAVSGEEVRTLSGHKPYVITLAFSQDGTRIASGSSDNTIRLWDAASGEELRTLLGHGNGKVDSLAFVFSVAFSPDGKRIVSGSNDRTIKLWDAASGEEVRTLSGHKGGVESVAFSPDGKRIVLGSKDRTIKLWEAASGEELSTLLGHGDGVRCVAFSPDGKRIASGSHDRTIKLWDVASGDELRTLLGHRDGVVSVAFSPDGKRIASGSKDRTTKLWGTASDEELRIRLGHKETVNSVAFSPDGTRIASGSVSSDAGTIKLFDVTSCEQLRTLQHTKQVLSVAFSPDGKRIASRSYGDDITIEFWDAASGEELRSSPEFSAVAVSLNSPYNGFIKLWEATSGKSLPFPNGYTNGFYMDFSPDGTRVAAGHNGFIRLWDAVNESTLAGRALGGRTLKGHTKIVATIAFSPDGTRIASGSADRTIKLWDAASGEELRTLSSHPGWVSCVTFSPDGTRIASGHGDKIKLWDAAMGEEVRILVGHRLRVTDVAVSPDGTRIASGSDDRTIKLWDVASGEELRTLSGHTKGVTRVTFSPDGTRIASGDRSSITLWDAAKGEEVRTLAGYWEDGVLTELTSFDFSSDGMRIVSRSNMRNIDFDSLTGEPMEPAIPSDRATPQTGSPDGRWRVFPWRNDVVLVDLEFKKTPREKAFRELKARPDPWWHHTEAVNAEESKDWYAAVFHRAWVVKGPVPSRHFSDQRFADARTALQDAYHRWLTSLKDSKNDLPNPDVLLQPTVREALQLASPAPAAPPTK